MTSRTHLTPDDVCGKPAPKEPEFPDDKILRLWPQCAGELRGFAMVLGRNNANMTATQLRLAVQMADELYKQKTVGKVQCSVCKGYGSVNNPEYMKNIMSPTPGPNLPPWITCSDCNGAGWLDEKKEDRG